MKGERIIGIDPGSEQSGMVILDGGTDIIGAFNLNNEFDLYDKVTDFSIHPNLTIVIEDIKPYTLRLTPQVIDTCKFIGEAVFRFKKAAGLNVVLLSRYDVKRWVFDTFPAVCEPLISGKQDKKLFAACSVDDRLEVQVDNYGRQKRKSSFVYVDDKIVVDCMKHLYKIEKPSAGKGYEYGLKMHSWQALAVASCFYNDKLMTPIQTSI